PVVPDNDTSLNAVSCATATDCMAVGDLADGVFSMRWNGSTWSIVAISDPAIDFNAELHSVSCTSPTACVAVGGRLPGLDGTLIVTWTGTKWTRVPGATTGYVRAELFGVTCTSPSFCVAVGNGSNADGTGGVMIEHWTSTTWYRVVTPEATRGGSPQRSGVIPTLVSVSCASATACVAVGSTADRALVERWDGALWTISPTPDLPRPFEEMAELAAVSCASATDCSTVGHSYLIQDWNNGSGDPLEVPHGSVAMHWDGAAWTIVPRPNGAPSRTRF